MDEYSEPGPPSWQMPLDDWSILCQMQSLWQTVRLDIAAANMLLSAAAPVAVDDEPVAVDDEPLLLDAVDTPPFGKPLAKRRPQSTQSEPTCRAHAQGSSRVPVVSVLPLVRTRRK